MGTQQSCCSRPLDESATSNSPKIAKQILAELYRKNDSSEFKNKDRLKWKEKFPQLEVQEIVRPSVVKGGPLSYRISIETQAPLGNTVASYNEVHRFIPQNQPELRAESSASILPNTKQQPSANHDIKRFIIDKLNDEQKGTLQANIQELREIQLSKEEKIKKIRGVAQEITRFLCWLYDELGKKLELALKGRESFEFIVQWIVYDLLIQNNVLEENNLSAQTERQNFSWESLEVNANLDISQSLDQIYSDRVLEEAKLRIQKIQNEVNPVKKLFRMGQFNDLADEILIKYPDSTLKKKNHSMIVLYWIAKTEADLTPDIKWVESFCDPDPSKKIWEPFYCIKGWMDLLTQNMAEERQIDSAKNQGESMEIEQTSNNFVQKPEVHDPFDFSLSLQSVGETTNLSQHNPYESIFKSTLVPEEFYMSLQNSKLIEKD